MNCKCQHTIIFVQIAIMNLNIFNQCQMNQFEYVHNVSGRVRRKIGGGTGLIFKGSGYYLTDYRKKSSSSGTPSKKIKEEKRKLRKKMTNYKFAQIPNNGRKN